MNPVRLIIPHTRFEADGVDHRKDPSTFDTCELHGPLLRDTARRNGHPVVDATGDVRQLVAGYPAWTIFVSDRGRLYASTRVNASAQGTTLRAWLVAGLRRQMQRVSEQVTA